MKHQHGVRGQFRGSIRAQWWRGMEEQLRSSGWSEAAATDVPSMPNERKSQDSDAPFGSCLGILRSEILS